ncbi:MAG: DUF2156 domain-containing protein [Thermaerobacter sp.]|nr:DUF2156 domain-containing protein [Thermaerobacter sp.]MBS4055507.1 DUF2156 domain-containing protein [Thermaerobacter sp.]
MLEFKSLEVQDRAAVQSILAERSLMGNENVFGTLYIWGEVYKHSACIHEGTLYSLYGGDSNIYGVPHGGDFSAALKVLMADARAKGHRFRLWGMTKEQVAEVEREMPDVFRYRLDRDGSDYIYHTSDLVNLAGRKFHDKRNHLNRFRRTYDYTYEDLTEQNLPDVVDITREWIYGHSASTAEELFLENCAITRAVKHFSQLGLQGGLIRILGKPVAFTLGEAINSEVFLVHFEKALSGYNGLYAAINQEFAARQLASYKYVNREEDMGIEGLRNSKLSYNPAFILEKYIVNLKVEGSDD